MNEVVLLVEPGCKPKYPPLGLMKIAAYHKKRGDHVEFVKGASVAMRDRWRWDRIYVASLFTYDWARTVQALRFYASAVKPPIADNLVVGGVLATLMSEDLRESVDCRVVSGLLDGKGKLGYDDDDQIESILPDYGILDEIDYRYPASNAYLAYATRGCIRRCPFCAVPSIEPQFKTYVPLKEQVELVAQVYGPRRDLLLLDNNVLASGSFARIIADIKALGFEKGARFTYRNKGGQSISAQRHVDFNQGVDIRLLTDRKMSLLSEIAIKPLRLAFDSIGYKQLYEKKIRLAAKYGITDLSNYVLFNFFDRPEDLHARLHLNVKLNKELGLQIFSFPMRYINLESKNRLATTPGNIGPYWNRKYLRAIQCILVKTRGVVGTHLDYFEEAFGRDVDEFKRVLIMPEDYIIHRHSHQDDGSTDAWWRQYQDLTSLEKQQLLAIVESHLFDNIDASALSKRVLRVLDHYMTGKRKAMSVAQHRLAV